LWSKKRQVQDIIELLKEQDDNFGCILWPAIDDDDDLIAYFFESDHGFLDRRLFYLFKQCFQETKSMRRLTTDFLFEQEEVYGVETSWQRNR
jgi:hypothetical protein